MKEIDGGHQIAMDLRDSHCKPQDVPLALRAVPRQNSLNEIGEKVLTKEAAGYHY